MGYLIALTLCLSSILCSAQSFEEFQIHHRINPEVYQVNEGQRITVKLTSGKRVVGFFKSIDEKNIFLTSFDGSSTIHAVPKAKIGKINIKKAYNEIGNVALFIGSALTSSFSLGMIIPGFVYGYPEMVLLGVGGGIVTFFLTRYAVNQLSYRLPIKDYKLVMPNSENYYKAKK